MGTPAHGPRRGAGGDRGILGAWEQTEAHKFAMEKWPGRFSGRVVVRLVGDWWGYAGGRTTGEGRGHPKGWQGAGDESSGCARVLSCGELCWCCAGLA